ncbi:MAG: AsnC family transcriptional regulator [Candidatus Helarchaeota archaeon]|nr:AsnC family transcriptional regulator [Candidatus Helarchaeota archaeon]
MKQLDELDHRIIQVLKEDSRIAYTKIADELQVSESTVNFRIKKFKNSNIIKKFTISISPEKLGYNFGGLLKIKVGSHIVKEMSKLRTREIGKIFARHKNFCFLAIAEDGITLHGMIFAKGEKELEAITTELRHKPDIIELAIIPFITLLKGNDLLGINVLC